jgi:hypothetical protein
MSGESPRHHEEARSQTMPADAARGAQDRSQEDRVGPYGGDDGALEHERTEIDASEKPTPDDVGSTTKKGRTTER